MITVMAWQTAVVHRRGRFEQVLTPGRHRLSRFGRRFVRVDTRATSLTVSGQEVPTSDGVPVKVNARLVTRVTDARRWVEATDEPREFLYDAVKVAVRDLVRGASFEQVCTGIVVDRTPETLAAVADQVGATVERFDIVDVVAPAQVRRAAADLVAARGRAEVAIEEARTQTAVLRHLANVSSVLEASPALAALKLVETAAEHGGSIVVERPASATT